MIQSYNVKNKTYTNLVPQFAKISNKSRATVTVAIRVLDLVPDVLHVLGGL